jgi:predicted nucleic acid-binding protein
VFIDTSLNSTEFGKFINQLRENRITLVTIDAVRFEFLKGAPNLQKYKEKEELIERIVDAYLPIQKDILDNADKLLQLYKEDGKSLSITDLLLGATLMHYKTNLFLLTKNTTDFPSNIFTLSTHINLLYRKGLHVYGVYQYLNSNWKGNRDL